jgi:hypothetical protein
MCENSCVFWRTVYSAALLFLSAGWRRATTNECEVGQIVDGEPQMAGKRPKHGFHEYVKNPDLFREESQESAIAESTLAPTAEELVDLVSIVGRRRLEYEEILKLKKAGDRAVSLLVEALQDEKFLFRRYGDSVLDGSAIETALDLLEPFGLPKAAVLKPALQHPDEDIRSRALYYLARCANDDAINALATGLKSQSEEDRTWTLLGLEFLRDSPRGSKRFRAALFQAVVPLLADEESGPAGRAPRTLLALDVARAKGVLLGADVFRPENTQIDDILKALKDAKVPVPGRQLRELLARIKQKATKYSFANAYAYGLILLAQAEGEEAGDLIRDAQTWGNEQVKEGAAEASAIVAGAADAYSFVIDLYQQKGAKGLTKPQLYYLTLFWLDAEVKNGGFTQFYFNSSGDLAPQAVKAARAVGATELAGIIQQANALFGKNGPDPDRDKRMDQLSGIDLEGLEELDSRFYKSAEHLNQILPQYVASNSEVFKRRK